MTILVDQLGLTILRCLRCYKIQLRLLTSWLKKIYGLRGRFGGPIKITSNPLSSGSVLTPWDCLPSTPIMGFSWGTKLELMFPIAMGLCILFSWAFLMTVFEITLLFSRECGTLSLALDFPFVQFDIFDSLLDAERFSSLLISEWCPIEKRWWSEPWHLRD